ncbi:MAG: hypothetical protein ABIA76_05330 [Candidatus Diapherotrites archaeon]
MLRKGLFFGLLVFLAQSVFAENYLWDSLRPLASMASNYDFLTRALVMVLSFVIFFISVKAYLKLKSSKLMFVSIAFGLFALKWVLKVLDLFLSPGLFFGDASENVFELLILASLFYALFVK